MAETGNPQSLSPSLFRHNVYYVKIRRPKDRPHRNPSGSINLTDSGRAQASDSCPLSSGSSSCGVHVHALALLAMSCTGRGHDAVWRYCWRCSLRATHGLIALASSGPTQRSHPGCPGGVPDVLSKLTTTDVRSGWATRNASPASVSNRCQASRFQYAYSSCSQNLSVSTLRRLSSLS